jgi:hypothetical protein
MFATYVVALPRGSNTLRLKIELMEAHFNNYDAEEMKLTRKGDRHRPSYRRR